MGRLSWAFLRALNLPLVSYRQARSVVHQLRAQNAAQTAAPGRTAHGIPLATGRETEDARLTLWLDGADVVIWQETADGNHVGWVFLSATSRS